MGVGVNLVQKMGKRELWDYLQKDAPLFATFLKDANNEFGKIDFTEYRVDQAHHSQREG